MEEYTIYCTEEQTKKALELGAPIERGHEGSRYFNIGVPTFFDKNDEICRVKNSVIFIPTAEQVIEWLLNEHDILCDIFPRDGCFGTTWFAFRFTTLRCKRKKYESNTKDYPSRKEATLAAIDAALDYLSKNKK